MLKQSLFFSMVMISLLFFACTSNGISSSDVNNLINGQNSIKGTISGTMLDNTAFSFSYDYHVTINDVKSYSDSWIVNDNSIFKGDSVLYIDQYFYADRNGVSDYGDQFSSSGKYMHIAAYIDMAKMKLMPPDFATVDLEGMWQNITSQGNRFVYGLSFNSGTPSGTMDLTNLKYDNKSQLLTGKMNVSLPDNHTQRNWYGNQKAAIIIIEFKIFVPKDNFQSINVSS